MASGGEGPGWLTTVTLREPPGMPRGRDEPHWGPRRLPGEAVGLRTAGRKRRGNRYYYLMAD
jgi:hypothetical protein